MEKNFAKKLVKDVLQHSFEKRRYAYLVRELLNHIKETPETTYRGNYIPDAYKEYVSTLDRIGKYVDPDGKKIDILIVHLKKETSLERARTMQRNFVAWFLKRRGEKDAALAAFTSPDQEDWRFSFVKMEYKFVETPKGYRTQQEFTPARRFSFLVGKDETSHTAQKQLVPFLLDDEHYPTLAQLEEAFSIEKVTKEFYEKYRELFLVLKEALDGIVKKDQKIKTDFVGKKVNTIDFAKKLLGQIVFLYFLQKKGWFGVERDADWGSGPKNFLRRLFEKRHSDYSNFFNDILEPLFYEALALERPDNFYSRFNCKIPFLNGGLFDPINNYDWVHTDILLPSELFSNDTVTKEGDIGTGILDVFDRYNFTVKEDEPLEKEVAVDPEMLGKVFENLLEVKDRKSKGTYYTPREIVHYMCQQSLINYLDTAVNTEKKAIVPEKPRQDKFFGEPEPQQMSLRTAIVPKEDITFLIQHGQSILEHDKRVETEGKETKRYPYRMPQSIRENAAAIDKDLEKIRISDPAIGSGAFLVGMMHEIVSARMVLSTYLDGSKNRTSYDFKRDAIQNCLYGVDIDPSAVEIAKLRLWLSLVVDEDDIKQIKPLPNLDYKIVCGNSLFKIEKVLGNLKLFEQLEQLKPLYFEETNVRKKHRFKNQIDDLIHQITNGHEDFDFEVYFSEVFHDKGGFDIVIANPPYVSHDQIKKKSELKQQFRSYEPFADLYCYFIEVGLRLENSKGIICFITSNSYLKANYGQPLRNILRQRNSILGIINIEDFQVFDAAIVNTCILLSQNKFAENSPRCLVVNASYQEETSFCDFIEKNKFYYFQNDFLQRSWGLISRQKLKLKTKIESVGKTLEEYHTKIRLGLATGANHAFIIDGEKRKELIRKDSKNERIIKPLLRGRDIYRYRYDLKDSYILLTKNSINIKEDYPSIYEYLDSFGSKFKKRGAKGKHWTNLRACSFFEDFKSEKIVWIELTDNSRFALCQKEVYLLNTAYFLISPPIFAAKYLLGILNSKVINFYLNLIAETSGMGVNRWINNFVKDFPIPQVDKKRQEQIILIVDKILNITKDSDYLENPAKQAKVKELEKKIDQMVYKLYGLTKEEIAIVEGQNKTD